VTAGQAGGVPVADLIAGVHNALSDRVVRMARRMPIGKEVILTGGCAKNIGLVKALSHHLGQAVLIPEEPLITGALGAALLGRDICRKAASAGSVPAAKASSITTPSVSGKGSSKSDPIGTKT
jgi:activator of 2-hydroxyglutaryl-CoA dehydratase